MTLAIDTEHLTKSYGESRGIVEVDLDVEAGDVFGFLGPNGAGKTTTIRILLDLIRPSSRTATVLGLDARRDSVAIRRRVGYLPGEYALYPRLTGAETLRYYGNLRGGLDWSYVETLARRSTSTWAGAPATFRPATSASWASSRRSCTVPSW